MSEPAKTVRIKYPANLRHGYANIPAAEFDPAIHELFEPDAPPPPPSDAPPASGKTVAKGPRGLFYIMDGDKRVSQGYANEADAIADMNKPVEG